VTAALAVGAGGIIAATSGEQVDAWEQAFGIGTPIVGGLLGALGAMMSSRATQASENAALATRAVANPNGPINVSQCNEALAAWTEGRAASLSAFSAARASGSSTPELQGRLDALQDQMAETLQELQDARTRIQELVNAEAPEGNAARRARELTEQNGDLRDELTQIVDDLERRLQSERDSAQELRLQLLAPPGLE